MQFSVDFGCQLYHIPSNLFGDRYDGLRRVLSLDGFLLVLE
jgi:hypothetical protein